ncbi:MAG: OmpA family protein [Methyloprofundus sp.]|nr:OmpA family protein [Methyloprofundus sp.]
MTRLLTVFILTTFLSACQTTSDDAKKRMTQSPGELTFGATAGMDPEQYLFEQHAIFRNKLLDKGVESRIEGDKLILNIPGNITFGVNSAKLNWNVHNILNQITPVLQEYYHSTILVYGHSDAKGDAVINQRLSEQRARVIRDYFVRSGIDPVRVTAKGRGVDELLVAEGITSVDRSLNRRVTLEITAVNRAAPVVDAAQ